MILQVVVKVYTTFSNAQIFWKIFFPAFKVKISRFCWKKSVCRSILGQKKLIPACKVLRKLSNLVLKGSISRRIHLWDFTVDWAILIRPTLQTFVLWTTSKSTFLWIQIWPWETFQKLTNIQNVAYWTCLGHYRTKKNAIDDDTSIGVWKLTH